jgi:hypothetical protein
MQKDTINMCQSCEICQRLGPLGASGKGPLKPVMAFEPFMKWGLNLMGPIKLTTQYTSNQYILIVTNYTTK